jgi:colanic acid biosynthesis glycosyl transferase WcaI
MSNQRSVLFLSQWFPPEHAPMGYMLKELAENLAAQEWEVEVVTGFPNHPSGKVKAPYVKQRILRETQGSIRITRLWLYTSETRSFLSRALNFLSFVLSSFFYLLTCKKPDLVFAVLQPLPLGATLTLLAKLRGFKLIFNVQDLHPDVLVDLGLIKNKSAIRALK